MTLELEATKDLHPNFKKRWASPRLCKASPKYTPINIRWMVAKSCTNWWMLYTILIPFIGVKLPIISGHQSLYIQLYTHDVRNGSSSPGLCHPTSDGQRSEELFGCGDRSGHLWLLLHGPSALRMVFWAASQEGGCFAEF